MSVEHLTVVLHHSKATGTAKLVLLGIANHQGDGGAWPSVATLAKYAGVQPRGVQKALEKLRSLGEVRVQLQAGGTPGMDDHDRPNLYEVLVACPPWCDRSAHHRDTRARQGALWTNPPSVRTPPVRTDTPPGVPQDTPRVSGWTPEPSNKPSIEKTSVGRSTTDRARERHDAHDMCHVCSLERWDCERRDPAVTGHTFTPITKESRSA